MLVARFAHFVRSETLSAISSLQQYKNVNINKLSTGIAEQKEEFIQQQPRGIQNLLSNSNLHDTYKKYLLPETYSATTTDIADAWSLFPEVYTDDAFFKVEQEKVFKQSWIAIGHKSSHLLSDGDVLSTFVGSVPIIITNYKGELKGFYNVCRHRGSVLLQEGNYTKCNIIRCPYHSWSYSCSGKLMGAPYFNDDKMPLNEKQRKDPTLKNEMFQFKPINFNKDEYGLFEFGVKEFMGTLFVNLDTNISRRERLWNYQMGDLNEHYGYYPYDNMRIIEQYEYTINSNWKMISENFIEYYHLPWVHPELCQVSSVANHIRRQGCGQYTGFATYPLTYGGTAADPDAFEPFAGINDVDKEASWFIQIFPNVSYFLFPHHLATLITYPQSPGVTKEKMTLLMDKSIKEKIDNNDVETKNKVKELSDFYVMVNDQDIKAVEKVQKGVQCNNVYRGGRLSAKFEEPVYRFQNMLVDYMTDDYLKEYPGDDDFVKSEFLKQ